MASGRIAALQRVQVLLASGKLDEFQTIVNEAIDEALHELQNPKESILPSNVIGSQR